MDFAEKDYMDIVVKTNASKTEIVSEDEGILKVNVKAQPEKGKANLEILKLFSKLSKKEVKIISGRTSKKKRVKFS